MNIGQSQRLSHLEFRIPSMCNLCPFRRCMLTLAQRAFYTDQELSSSFLRNSSIRGAFFAALLVSPILAATCQFIGGPQFGGIEPPLRVDADCTDPDYN